MNVEHCVKCDEATGRAGRGDDSLFDTDGKGPYCEDCWDKTGEPMKKEIGGKVYVQVPETLACNGCAAERGDDLCLALHGDNTICSSKIWEEEKMSQKTAVELVDELHSLNGVTRDIPQAKIEQLKSAIEREQMEGAQHVNDLLKEVEELKSAKSAITMRPISELPDKVPDGCVIVCVNADVITGTWYYELDICTMRAGATHFYILPLPKPDRKIKACPVVQGRPG